MRTPAAGCFAGVTGSIRAVGFQAGPASTATLCSPGISTGPRFLQIQELSPRNVLHAFRLTSPADINAEFVTWLAEPTGSAPKSTSTPDKHRSRQMRTSSPALTMHKHTARPPTWKAVVGLANGTNCS